MLSTQDINALLAQVEYRPGWRIKAFDCWEGVMVRITADVPNAYNPSETVTLGVNSYVDPGSLASEADFVTWLSWRLRRMEIHESMEWLRWKVTGGPIFDPHGSF